MDNKLNQVTARIELAGGRSQEWFDGLKSADQKKYLKENPNSKFKPGGSAGTSKPKAPADTSAGNTNKVKRSDKLTAVDRTKFLESVKLPGWSMIKASGVPCLRSPGTHRQSFDDLTDLLGEQGFKQRKAKPGDPYIYFVNGKNVLQYDSGSSSRKPQLHVDAVDTDTLNSLDEPAKKPTLKAPAKAVDNGAAKRKEVYQQIVDLDTERDTLATQYDKLRAGAKKNEAYERIVALDKQRIKLVKQHTVLKAKPAAVTKPEPAKKPTLKAPAKIVSADDKDTGHYLMGKLHQFSGSAVGFKSGNGAKAMHNVAKHLVSTDKKAQEFGNKWLAAKTNNSRNNLTDAISDYVESTYGTVLNPSTAWSLIHNLSVLTPAK